MRTRLLHCSQETRKDEDRVQLGGIRRSLTRDDDVRMGPMGYSKVPNLTHGQETVLIAIGGKGQQGPTRWNWHTLEARWSWTSGTSGGPVASKIDADGMFG